MVFGALPSEVLATFPAGEMALSPDAVQRDLFANGAGTVEDPHVYLGLVRDHRGMKPGGSNYRAFHDALRALEERKVELEQQLASTRRGDARWRELREMVERSEDTIHRLTHASMPFETFTNLSDGKKWGKYYSVDADFIVVKPVPPSLRERIKDFIKDIGNAIVWFVTEVLLGVLAALCDQFTDATDHKAAVAAGTAVIGAATGGATAAAVASAIETARKICKGIQIVNALWEATKDPKGDDIDEGDPDRPSERVISQRGGLTPEPTYPAGAVAIFDSSLSKFRIFVPGSAA